MWFVDTHFLSFCLLHFPHEVAQLSQMITHNLITYVNIPYPWCANKGFPHLVFQDLVKSHLMYAVREEVEVLKEHIKELYERNSVLERENAVLKSLANSEQLGQLSSQLTQSSSSTSPLLQQQHPPVTNNTTTPLSQLEGSQSVHHQPNITSA